MLYAELSGAKKELLDKLPQPDRKSYTLIGIYNVLIITCLTSVCFILLHKLQFSYIFLIETCRHPSLHSACRPTFIKIPS